MNLKSKLRMLSIAGLIITLTIFACVTAEKQGPPATLSVAPEEAALSPALIKQPIMFSGTGWNPNEMVVVNLIIPEGITVKGVNPGEDVGLATATADADGNFSTPVGPVAVLVTIFQVDWNDTTMKPDFKKATPLRPGKYNLEAIGLESDKKANAVLTLVAPPKKS